MSPAVAREALRGRLQLIVDHSPTGSVVKRIAAAALDELTAETVRRLIKTPAVCPYRTELETEFRACLAAGGFDAC